MHYNEPQVNTEGIYSLVHDRIQWQAFRTTVMTSCSTQRHRFLDYLSKHWRFKNDSYVHYYTCDLYESQKKERLFP
jgi:hypothetical protein